MAYAIDPTASATSIVSADKVIGEELNNVGAYNTRIANYGRVDEETRAGIQKDMANFSRSVFRALKKDGMREIAEDATEAGQSPLIALIQASPQLRALGMNTAAPTPAPPTPGGPASHKTQEDVDLIELGRQAKAMIDARTGGDTHVTLVAMALQNELNATGTPITPDQERVILKAKDITGKKTADDITASLDSLASTAIRYGDMLDEIKVEVGNHTRSAKLALGNLTAATKARIGL